MQLQIPDTLLKKYPNLSKNELRSIIAMVLRYKSYKLKTSILVDFKVPHLGRIKTHGNKKNKKYLIADRKKKKKNYDQMLLTKEKLLF